MGENAVLKWLEGDGWLVLSGGVDTLSDIRAQSLSRITLEGPIVYIGLDEADHDDLIEDMGELGAPAGFLLNILTEDDQTIRDALMDAAMVVIPDDEVAAIRSTLTGAAIEGIQAAYERGAVILVEGDSISLFGDKLLRDRDEDEVIEGFRWIEDAFFTPVHPGAAQIVRDMLTMKLVQVAVSIGVGSALVIGADGQIEIWGNQVTIALGDQMTHL